jgi:very-short-patch-repair endonuclease/predicted transcriptional regulator of viral defense system
MVTHRSYRPAGMDPRDELIETIAARQRSLFTRRQVDEVGFRQEHVLHRLRTGRWSERRHLVYALLGAAEDDRTDLLADVLAAQPRAVASHRSAAAVYGLPGFRPRPAHVTVADHWERDRTSAVVHRTLFLPEHHLRILDAIPCTSLARTLFDLCGTERLGRSARAVDNALARKLVTIPALWSVLLETKARGRAGSTVLRALLRERGPSYVAPATELERRFVELTHRHGLPDPRRQVDVGDSDRWIGRVDFLYGTDLVIEVDSAEHHTSLLDRAADAARDDALDESGRRVLRFTWDDVVRRPRRVADTVRRSLATVKSSFLW